MSRGVGLSWGGGQVWVFDGHSWGEGWVGVLSRLKNLSGFQSREWVNSGSVCTSGARGGVLSGNGCLVLSRGVGLSWGGGQVWVWSAWVWWENAGLQGRVWVLPWGKGLAWSQSWEGVDSWSICSTGTWGGVLSWNRCGVLSRGVGLSRGGGQVWVSNCLAWGKSWERLLAWGQSLSGSQCREGINARGVSPSGSRGRVLSWDRCWVLSRGVGLSWGGGQVWVWCLGVGVWLGRSLPWSQSGVWVLSRSQSLSRSQGGEGVDTRSVCPSGSWGGVLSWDWCWVLPRSVGLSRGGGQVWVWCWGCESRDQRWEWVLSRCQCLSRF